MKTESTNNQDCGRSDGRVMGAGVLIVLVLLALMVSCLALVFTREAKAGAWLDGTLTVSDVRVMYWTKEERETSGKPGDVQRVQPVRDLGLGGDEPAEDEPNYRDPDNPAPLHCPFPDPDWCGKDGGK